jgi:hypothetical protein
MKESTMNQKYLLSRAVEVYRDARHPKSRPGETMDHAIGLMAVLDLVVRETVYVDPRQLSFSF